MREEPRTDSLDFKKPHDVRSRTYERTLGRVTHKISHPGEIGKRTVVQFYNPQDAPTVDDLAQVELTDEIQVGPFALAQLDRRFDVSKPLRIKNCLENCSVDAGAELSDEMVFETLK